jgi:hypothetical protein
MYMKRREPQFTFFSSGNSSQFKPKKWAYDPASKTRRSLLAIHAELVVVTGEKHTFILDNYGKEVNAQDVLTAEATAVEPARKPAA